MDDRSDDPGSPVAWMAERINAALPQTQCTRCGYPDCRRYAQAIAAGEADINQCPPGGAEGIRRLAAITGRPELPLNPYHGQEGPVRLALIDETWCIGCTLCIKACPVDCILGASKRMHTVLADQCTGCELCIPACPVDCISLVTVAPERTGWDAWSEAQAQAARGRYEHRQMRLDRDRREHESRMAARAAEKLRDLSAHSAITDAEVLDAKKAAIEAALARVQAKRQDPTPP